MSYKSNGKKKKIVDSPHKNPFSPMNIGSTLNSKLEDKVILSNLGKKDIVFGSFAFNRQVKFPFPYKKTPKGDIDIKSKKPLFTALKIERALDKNANMNNYHIEILEHDKGKTFRIKSKSRNQVVADVGRLDKKIPTKLIDGNLFETLGARKKAVKSLIKSPDAEYRRDKDQKMMGYINRYENQILNRKNVGFDISKPLVKDTDGDGLPDFIDCNPENPNEKGAIHDWLEQRRLKKQMSKENPDLVQEDMASDYGQIETEKEQRGYNKEQNKEVMREIKEHDYFEEHPEQKRLAGIASQVVKASYENVDKNFSKIARDYTKRGESTYQRTPHRERAINYMIPAPQKMYQDPDTGEPCSIPRFRREKYVAFSPPSVGGLYRPHQAPNPPWLVEKQKQRELARLYLRQQMINEAQRGGK